jgi:hypothetical protein
MTFKGHTTHFLYKETGVCVCVCVCARARVHAHVHVFENITLHFLFSSPSLSVIGARLVFSVNRQ